MIYDVHAHLDLLKENKLKEIQKNKKIGEVISNSINIKSFKKNLELSKKFPKIKVAAGFYPEEDISLKKYYLFEKIVLKNKKKIFAMGEIGLDLYYTRKNFELQKEIFKNQLNLARKLSLPVIIHTRKAEKQSLEILENYKDLKIILHCFSGNFKLVKKAIEMGVYFSIPANIIRSEHFQKLVKEVPKQRVLTETDSPYLSPFKEKQNEPAFISESIKKISEIWDKPKEQTERIIEKNYKKVFKE